MQCSTWQTKPRATEPRGCSTFSNGGRPSTVLSLWDLCLRNAMVSNDSLERAERRLSVPAVLGRPTAVCVYPSRRNSESWLRLRVATAFGKVFIGCPALSRPRRAERTKQLTSCQELIRVTCKDDYRVSEKAGPAWPGSELFLLGVVAMVTTLGSRCRSLAPAAVVKCCRQ